MATFRLPHPQPEAGITPCHVSRPRRGLRGRPRRSWTSYPTPSAVLHQRRSAAFRHRRAVQTARAIQDNAKSGDTYTRVCARAANPSTQGGKSTTRARWPGEGGCGVEWPRGSEDSHIFCLEDLHDSRATLCCHSSERLLRPLCPLGRPRGLHVIAVEPDDRRLTVTMESRPSRWDAPRAGCSPTADTHRHGRREVVPVDAPVALPPRSAPSASDHQSASAPGSRACAEAVRRGWTVAAQVAACHS